ncbi:recQ-mediated genome instability protein [Ceratobasidium sp. AG-Ba]|nr:recQ-mediated genome instability protein [Ceratobasidium sp. AG-Ba]QRW03786.1 recQ-mediated genome instability protein [Ceratobasidium sp. AG-Ba]
MPLPPRLVNWLKATYQRPQINPEWLEACYEYITTELGVNSDDFETLKSHVDEQFLQSSLTDSVLPNNGLPAPDSHDIRIKNTLCEVVAITEIGHSAFSLKNMTARTIRDGHKTMRAIEYRRIPELELGVTPLGLKIYLKDVNVRRGIIFLEPNGIKIKGYQTEEFEQNQDRDFVRGLRLRMRLPEEDPNEQRAPDPRPEPGPVNRANPPATQPVVSRPVTGGGAGGAPVQRPVNPSVPTRQTASSTKGKAPVVDLDPQDLDVDFEDSYSIGDGIGDETLDINDAFLQELEEAEQRALMREKDEVVIDSDEEIQPEIKPKSKAEPKSKPNPKPGPSKRMKVEEVIDISD